MVKQKTSIVFVFLMLAVFIAVPVVIAQDDIKEHRSCNHCGMDRKAYGYSRMLVKYEDGIVVGLCSLHCAVVEMGKDPVHKVKAIEVADRDTRKMIDAEQAQWAIGGKKRGVMTQRAKWAFHLKSAAEAFIKANGGNPATWAEAFAAAREDLAKEPR